MSRDSAIKGLRARVDRILQIIEEGRKSLAVNDVTEWKAMALTRWQLMRALADLRSYKQDRLLDPIIAAGGEEGERAHAMQMHNNELELTYRDFARRWELRGPLAADSPYRIEAMHFVRNIEQQLLADLAELETLSRTSGPWPAVA